jgi:hypothetical protein
MLLADDLLQTPGAHTFRKGSSFLTPLLRLPFEELAGLVLHRKDHPRVWIDILLKQACTLSILLHPF